MEMRKRTKASCFSNLYFKSASFLSKGHSSAKFKEYSVLLLLSAITSPQLKNLSGLTHIGTALGAAVSPEQRPAYENQKE